MCTPLEFIQYIANSSSKTQVVYNSAVTEIRGRQQDGKMSSDGSERTGLQNLQYTFHVSRGLPAVASLHSDPGPCDVTSHQHTSLIHTAQLLQVLDPCFHLFRPHNWMLSAPMQKSAARSWTQAQGTLSVPYRGPVEGGRCIECMVYI